MKWLLLMLLAALLVACAPIAAPDDIPTGEAIPEATLLPDEEHVEEAALAAARPREVTIWTLDIGARESDRLLNNADILGEINPFWYTLGANGSIISARRTSPVIEELRARGVRMLPTIGNEFDRQRVHTAIGAPAARSAHVQLLLDLVLDNGYDGLDVDYESLFAADREAFSLFIEELAQAFHAHDKLLSIAVHPKTDDEGSWDGPRAQDYARLGAAVDSFKVMTYDYSWSTSPAGPIAPIEWVDSVMAYTTSVMPAHKVYMGIPFYAYDWVGSIGEGKVWDQVQVLLDRHDVEVTRDPSNEGTFSYGLSTIRTVYFADALALETKLDAIFAKYPALAGVAIWRLGGEDPQNWEVLRAWAQE